MDQPWDRIEAWLRANAPEIADGLNPPASAEEIARTERFLNVRFPEDVSASYLRHNGQLLASPGLMEGWVLLSLERIRAEWKVWKELLDRGDLDGLNESSGKVVRTDWWNPSWIPLTSLGTGDHHCLDLAPGPRGKPGQIIVMYHDFGARPVIARSFGKWLTKFADALEAGEFVIDEFGGLCRRDEESEEDEE